MSHMHCTQINSAEYPTRQARKSHDLKPKTTPSNNTHLHHLDAHTRRHPHARTRAGDARLTSTNATRAVKATVLAADMLQTFRNSNPQVNHQGISSADAWGTPTIGQATQPGADHRLCKNNAQQKGWKG